MLVVSSSAKEIKNLIKSQVLNTRIILIAYGINTTWSAKDEDRL